MPKDTLELLQLRIDIIENLQSNIVRAGGCFFTRTMLERHSVIELIELCTRNGIHVEFSPRAEHTEN